MRKRILFSALLSLFLLVQASIIWAQNITQEKGLTTATFNVSQGTIRVYLPDDIRQGDVVTGTVTAIPEGRNEKQSQRNLSELLQYAVVFNGQKFTFDIASRSFRFIAQPVSSTQQGLSLLQGNNTNPVQQLNIPAKPLAERKPTPVQCVIPGHVLTGSPMNIPGPFDGNATNTQCTIGNQPATILAESPRNCVVSFPGNVNGIQSTVVQENGEQACTKEVSAVQMEVSAGKLNLQKGENTFIDVKISGLQNLENTAVLKLVNVTPETVALQPSNVIVIPLEPANVSGGNFNQRFNVNSIRTGTFTCNVNIDFGDIMLTPGPGDNQEKTCLCDAEAYVVLFKTEGDIVTYMATPKVGCRGEKCPYNPTLKFTWQIESGQGNADIIEIDKTGFTVKVRRKNNGGFTMRNSVTVTCVDGNSCTDDVLINEKSEEIKGAGVGDKPGQPPVSFEKDPPKIPTVDTIPPPGKVCGRVIFGDNTPQLGGGLKLGTFGSGQNQVVLPPIRTIRRDEFIPLVAEGADYDRLRIYCIPGTECTDKPSKVVLPLPGRVKFDWKILNEKGQFVKLGCSYSNGKNNQQTEGEQVIFMPPYVELPVLKNDTTVSTFIELMISDAIGGQEMIKEENEDKIMQAQLKDDPVSQRIEIITTRYKNKPDEYRIEIKVSTPTAMPVKPPKELTKGSCEEKHGDWMQNTDFQPPQIILPNVADSNKWVPGQWIVLEAKDQQDKDILPGIVCISKNECETTLPVNRAFEDNVQWYWDVSGVEGKFVGGRNGRFVVYELSKNFNPAKAEAKITLKVFNPENIMVTDAELSSSVMDIKIFQPGVKLTTTPADFLPTENSKLDFTSSLVIQQQGWVPAPEHACRIQFFELFDVSNEKGVCMNSPLPDIANKCRDLKLLKGEKFECFDTTQLKECPDNTSYFLLARTQVPVNKATIQVQCEDFGAWGSLRSFANVITDDKRETDRLTKIKSQKPYYYPVPVTEEEVRHPLHSEATPRGIYNHPDNRVSIPRDVDNNHIADAGWSTATGWATDPVSVFNKPPDPKKLRDAKRLGQDLPPENDMDNIPVGDGFKGDGLGSYEEYRGFMISPKKALQHQRTNPATKDVFVCNEQEFDVSLYREVSKLGVHEINMVQFNGINNRVINFNSSDITNVVKQRGVYLKEGGEHANLLGLAIPEIGNMPSTPNYIKEVNIYSPKVQSVIDRFGLNPTDKFRATVAHELLHANNVCHHGEQNEATENSHDIINGLRSGDIFCVMHYDNSGTRRDKDYLREPTGSRLCVNRNGNGYNDPANRVRGLSKESPYLWFGPAQVGRGNCAGMIRISGRGAKPTDCGDRLGTDGKLKNPFKN